MPDDKPIADLVVGDRFWLGYAQEMVKAALSAPDRRAEQLNNGIAWFWTVYSAAVLVVFSTRTQALPPALSVLLALPTALLMVAYWLASEVRAPILIEFDPRVPSEIEAAHRHAVLQKNRKLSVAAIVTGVAGACVVVAGILALLSTAHGNTDLHAYVGPKGSGKLMLFGTFPKGSIVRVSVRAFDAPVPTVELSQLQHASEKGEVLAEMTVPEARAYRVTATWNEEQVEKSITIHVKHDD